MAEERVFSPKEASVTPEKRKARLFLWGRVMVAVVTVITASLYLYLGSLPTEVTETLEEQELTFVTEFDYRVFPEISLLYPTDEPLGPGPAFFTRVTREVELAFTTEITGPPAIPLAGTYQVWLVLEAPGFWERRFLIQEPEAFRSEPGSPVSIGGSFPLDLRERITFTENVQRETGASPRDGYNIRLAPEVRLTTELPGEMKREHLPQFGFNIRSPQFTPVGELEQKQTETNLVQETKPGQASIAGVTVPVTPTRQITASIALLGAASMGLWVLVRRQRHRRWLRITYPASHINRRYRGRLVTAQGGIPQGQQLELGSFPHLLRIAEEQERPIIWTEHVGAVNNTYHYYVLTPECVYTASIIEPRVATSAPTRAGKGVGSTG